jgi:hypothetical protein
LQYAERLWLYPGADGDSSSAAAMNALLEARHGKRVIHQVLELIERGEIVQQATLRHCGQMCAATREVGAMKRLLAKVTAEAINPGDYEVIGEYLDLLLDMHQHRVVLNWAGMNQQHTRANLQIWTAVGAAWAKVEKPRAAAWMAEWRSWPDADQPVAAMHARLALDIGDYAACCHSAREGLDRLEPTPAAKSLAESLFYGFMGLERWNDYLEAYEQFHGALHYGGRPSPLSETFACIRRLLQSPTPAQAAEIHQRVQDMAARGMVWMPQRIVKVYNQLVKRNLGKLRRLNFKPLG